MVDKAGVGIGIVSALIGSAEGIKNANGPPWGKGLLDSISQWRGNAKPNDDLTLLEIWRDPD